MIIMIMGINSPNTLNSDENAGIYFSAALSIFKRTKATILKTRASV